MSSSHQTGKTGSILGVIFAAFVFLLPTPAGSKDTDDPTALRLSPRDISRLKKESFWNFQAPGLEPIAEYGSFFGLKITLKLQGGWNTFPGGEVENGILGLYDNAAAAISSSGTSIVENVRESSHSGIEASGDLIYSLTPRFGIGIGAARINAGKRSQLVFLDAESWPQVLRIDPEIKVSAFRAGLFYSLPFAGLLAISVHGGPALYSAEHSFSLGGSASFLRQGLVHTGYFQKATAKQIGFEGALGFEFNANRFVCIFVEVQGRYAKIDDLEGDERADFIQDNRLQSSAEAGPVYFLDTGAYPELDIIPSGGAVPGSAHQAMLDFSGVSILAGLKLRL